MSAFLVIGHRGAAGLAPEHTRPSFERAIEAGVDMIEIDVQLTRDGELVVLHDRELGRTIAGDGPVRDRTLAELARHDSGGWFSEAFKGEGALSLPELFTLLAGRAPLNVEIKSPEPDWLATAERLTAILRQAGELERTVVSSFEMGALAAVRAVMPAVRIGVLWHLAELGPAWEWAARLRATSIHPYAPLADAQLVQHAHERALAVYTWTVNDEDDMDRAQATGVDGIISDFPDRLRAVRDRVARAR